VKRFATAAFLSLAPTNLSRGFRVESTFGLDYALQTELLGELPEKLRLSLSEGLAQRSYGDALKSLKVELASASGSSLDLAIIADFDGAAAGSRSEIERALQQLAVAASERHGWSIPFPQVVVHRASATVA